MRDAYSGQSAARIISLATAVPPHKFMQESSAERWDTLFPNNSKMISGLMAGISGNCGVESQYSANPLSWFSVPHGYSDCNQSYIDASVELLADAGQRCLNKANATARDVDTIVFVSSWGLSTGVDVRIMQRLGLRQDVRRVPVLGLGCAGGVLALARAADMAKANPGSLVLMLVVELPATIVRHNDASKNNLLSAALCGDGAAAALISCQRGGTQIRSAREYTWPEEINLMGMKVGDDGPRLVMPEKLPGFLRSELLALATGFLAESGMTIGDIQRLAFHPGGKEVLKLYKDAFSIDDEVIDDEWKILKGYGNMSGVTILFVLESYLAKRQSGPMLLTALGPGLTLAFTLLDVTHDEPM